MAKANVMTPPQEFKPVVLEIVLETEAELAAFYAGLNTPPGVRFGCKTDRFRHVRSHPFDKAVDDVFRVVEAALNK